MAARSEDNPTFRIYQVTVPDGTPNLTIAVTWSGADLDLAMKIGAPIVHYDDVAFSDVTNTLNPSHTIDNPAPGPIYIDVLNLVPNPAAYNLSVVVGNGATSPLAPPAPAGQNPLAPAPADPFVGSTFSGDDLVLELVASKGAYSGRLLFGGQEFPVTAQASVNALSGTFTSSGSGSAFTATLTGSTLVYATDEQSYTLQKSP